MRLLVTRPIADAMPLAEQLAVQGHDVIVSPLIHIEANDTPLPDAATIGALALTSANGVRALAARLHDEVAYKIWATKPAYAVGSQTAAALAQLGWPDIRQAAGDVKSLAALICATTDPPAQAAPILHIAGRETAGDLAGLLAAADIATVKAVLYHAQPATEFTRLAAAALCDATAPIDAVLLYSPRSADIFLSLYRGLDTPIAPHAYCLSAAVALHMQEAGFETRVAVSPDGDAMRALAGVIAKKTE